MTVPAYHPQASPGILLEDAPYHSLADWVRLRNMTGRAGYSRGMADITYLGEAVPAPFMSERRRKGHIRNVFDIISYMTTMNKIIIQKIAPFLWFDHDAEEAAKFLQE